MKHCKEDDMRDFAYRALILISFIVSLFPCLYLILIGPVLNYYMFQAEVEMQKQIAECQEEIESYWWKLECRIHPERCKRLPRNILHSPIDNDTIISLIDDFLRSENRNTSCSCKGARGAKGLPGRIGVEGPPGMPGSPGIPARPPCQSEAYQKKLCADPCPSGEQGASGPTGPPGDEGRRGPQGSHGKNGEDGSPGPDGFRGPPGIPGLDGDVGDPGQDALPAPFIPGPPGPIGDTGPIGPPGPRGMPGFDGPPGPPGKRGLPGSDGHAGKLGAQGPPGPIGKQGTSGQKGVCPTYCAMDGGVFFIEPPGWFVDQIN